MDKQRVIGLLSGMHPVNVEVRLALENAFRPASYPKGHYLLQAQTAAQHLFFLDKGFAVGFQYHAGKRVVTHFWQSGDIVLSPKSFFAQWVNDQIIQLTVDSDLLSMPHSTFIQLVEKYPSVDGLARNIAANEHARSEERMIEIYTMKTWDRYLKLLKVYPGIEQFVSQELIASYLNIAPQSLSRLKASHH